MSPTCRIRTNSGRIATAVGNSSPNTNRVYKVSRPRNAIRANTNAASDANTTVTRDRDDRDDEAVRELAPEGRGELAEQDVGVVVEHPRVGDDVDRVGHVWPLVLKPPSTAYRIGTRIAVAVASITAQTTMPGNEIRRVRARAAVVAAGASVPAVVEVAIVSRRRS